MEEFLGFRTYGVLVSLGLILQIGWSLYTKEFVDQLYPFAIKVAKIS